MAIALDASSPAAVGSSGATTTTAAFTPPNACVIVAMVSADANNGNNGETVSASDSASGTWNTAVLGNGNGGAVSAIFWRLCATSPGSMTVSCTDSFGAVAKRLLVQVWTGTDQTNPVGATVAGTTAGVSYTSTVNNSQGVSCCLTANATLTAGGTGNTLIDEAGGFDSGDAVATLNRTALTTTSGTTVTLTIAGTATIGHHVAAELVPPGSAAPALPLPTPRRRQAAPRPARGRVFAPPIGQQFPVAEIVQPRRTRGVYLRRPRGTQTVRPQVNPPIPTVVTVQPRRLRGMLPRRSRLTVVVQPQLNPPIPIVVAAQPRRLRGMLARRGRIVSPVQAQQTVIAPTWIPPWRRDWTVQQLLRRPGKLWQPPWVGVAAPGNPILPLGLARRPVRLLARRSGRLVQPPWIAVTPAAPLLPLGMSRRPARLLGIRRGRPVPPPFAPSVPIGSRRSRPAVSRRRGTYLRPVAPPVAPLAGIVVPAPHRVRLTLPARRGRPLVPLAAGTLPVSSPKPARIRPLAVRRARIAQLRLIGLAPPARTGRLASSVIGAGNSSSPRTPGLSSGPKTPGSSSTTTRPGTSSGTTSAGMVSGT